MFERLTEGLSRAFDRVRGRSGASARREFLDAIRDHLLEADAHPRVVDDLVARLEARLEREDSDLSLSPSERFLKDLREEVGRTLGQRPEPLRLKSKGTSAIMLVGLQGTGKTTSIGKLARHLAETDGRSVMLVPLDVRRPAAIDQLKVVGEQVGVPVWETPAGAKPVREANKALKRAAKDGVDVVLFDTAGRLAIDEELMEEISGLRDKLRPQEILYVLDAMAGQTAVSTAERFADAVKPTGIVLSKVDADPRGGAVLSVRAQTGIPVKFMGTGEKPADFETFDPDRIVDRLLDLGDIGELAERFDQSIDQAEAERLTEKMLSAKFNLEDFGKQLEMMGNLGPLEGILKMMPGGKKLARQAKDLNVAEQELGRTLAIIRSMTPLERRNPRLLNPSRKQRIAKGSGTSTTEVNRVIKRHKQMQKLMKQLKRFPMSGLKQMLGGGGGGPGGGMPGGGMPGGGGGLPPGLLGR